MKYLINDWRTQKMKITSSQIITIIASIIGSGALNTIISHILYNKKLKKELKIKGNNMIADKIQASLSAFRNLELRLTVNEKLGIEELIKQKDFSMLNDDPIYPEIFNDWKSYDKFLNAVHNCRTQHEKNLPSKIALNLIFIYKYIFELKLFMGKNGNENMLPLFGTIFIVDLQKWQKNADSLVIKEINNCNYKLDDHNSRRWKRLRQKIVEKQMKETVLYAIQNDCYKTYKKETVDWARHMIYSQQNH